LKDVMGQFGLIWMSYCSIICYVCRMGKCRI